MYIIKSIIENKDLSDEAFAVWCGLRNIMQKDKKKYLVSCHTIGFSLYGERPLTRAEANDIKNGYNELIEKGYIKETFYYNATDRIADLSKLYYEQGSEYYSDLTDIEMMEIMNIRNIGKSNHCKLLRYFTCMVGTFNRSSSMPDKYKGKIGGMSFDAFHNLIGVSSKTANKYNKILEKNQLLYIIRHGDFFQGVNANGQSELREIPNTYSRYCDRHLADSYMAEVHGYKYMNEQEQHRTVKANENRGLAQKYISLCKGKKYDIETIKEIYIYCLEWNEKQLIYHNEQISKGYKHVLQEKDMSVFNDYLLEICDVIDCA